MVDPTELYQVFGEPLRGEPPILLHNLTGFLDAGSAGRLVVEQLMVGCEHRQLAAFDLDALYDYRARRPRMTFLSDHFEGVDLPELLLHEVLDAEGTRFLLLHGPEPDFGWQRFVASVISLVERFDVALTVGLHAVPWPAPHTRPVGITAHATDRDLIPEHTSWVGSLVVPGHVAGLLELRLGEAGHPAMGFTAHVPHYLAAADYPRAAVTLLEAFMATTGLSLPVEALRDATSRGDIEIEDQISESPEGIEAVKALEMQYDAFVDQRGLPLLGDDGELPSGDEIAAQVESFLAQREAEGRDEP